jgi:DNA polymerase sigma
MEKEATRVKLENMAARVLPGAKLKPFGSTANGLSLRNSGPCLHIGLAIGLSDACADMDLCCLLPPHSGQAKTAAELVEELGTVIQQGELPCHSGAGQIEVAPTETNFMVKMLPRARIPIIKLVIPASPNSPFGMSCDIGFDNKLALQNTRLLLSYVQLDPRVRPLILFSGSRAALPMIDPS